jgi:hypothetical protein
MPLMLTPAMSERIFEYREPPSLPRPLPRHLVLQVRRRILAGWRFLQQVVQVRRRIPAGWRCRFLLPVENSSRRSFLEPVGPRVIQKAPVLSWFQLHFLPPIRTPLSWR